MKLNTQNPQTLSSTDTHIIQMAKMILASLLLILVLAYLWSNNKTKPIKKPSKPSNPPQNQQPQSPRIPNKLNRISSTQSYRFSMDDNYDQVNDKSLNNDSIENQQLLKGLLRQDQPLRQDQIYSLKESRQRFMTLLKQGPKPSSLIYLDEKDIQQRQERKKMLNEKHQASVQHERQKQKKNQQAQKEKLIKKQQALPNPPKQDKKPALNQRTVFVVNKPKQPEPTIDFKNISLGLPTETKKQETPNTQPQLPTINVNPPNIPKPQQKPVQMGQGLLSGLSNQLGSTSLFGANPHSTQPIIPFGQQPTEPKKEQTVSPPQPNTTIPKGPVLPSTQPPSTQPVQNTTQSASQAQQPSPVPPGPILPQVQQPSQSQPVQPVGSRPSNLSKPDYLQKLIDYGNRAKQQCQLKKTKINNFGRSISNLKQIYDTAGDFINTINLGDAKEMQTLACQIFDFLLNKTIPVWPKQQGWQIFPPRMKNQTMWKISISTYVLKLNIYRVMGYESLWLIVFGKLLSLLDFTWKRTQPIKRSATAYKELDLVKNNYFSLQKQDDMAPKYFTRLDLITYFLFCMTTFDPQLVGQYLCQEAAQDKATYEEIKKHKYKWSYTYFWILVDNILHNKTKTYFKPVLYMNILSSMYLQIRKNKMNSTEFEDFDHLRKFIVKQAIESTSPKALQENAEVQAMADLQEETRDFKFDGQDFIGQLETFRFYFKQKSQEYRKATDKNGFEQFVKRCSVFNYFKPDAK